MAAAVYSTWFLRSNNLGAAEIYQVPEGYRAIVRDVDFFCDGTASSSSAFFFDYDAGAIIWYVTFAGNSDAQGWRGRQVFDPGARFAIEGGGTPAIHARVCGYLLTLP